MLCIDIQTHDLKTQNSTITLDQQQQELCDSQEAHIKALLLDMNNLYSTEDSIGCILYKQNKELISLSN